MGSGSIKFYTTNAQMSLTEYIDIKCGFKPIYIVVAFTWGGIGSVVLIDIVKNTITQIIAMNPLRINPEMYEESANQWVKGYDTGFKIRPGYQTFTQNPAYFYVFGT